jgi:hypothetical protein
MAFNCSPEKTADRSEREWRGPDKSRQKNVTFLGDAASVQEKRALRPEGDSLGMARYTSTDSTSHICHELSDHS